MTTWLCEAPDCAPPTGQHREYLPPWEPGDHPDGCRGCVPAEAAPGLRLCLHCGQRIGRDAIQAARLYRALGQRLAGGGRTTDTIGAVTREPGYDLHPDVVETREVLRGELVGLARLISTERGIAPPPPSAAEIAAYIAHHAEWIAAHRAAGELAGSLRAVATDPRTWSLAYPGGYEPRTYIGECPIDMGAGHLCGERLYVRDGKTEIECGGCGTSAHMLDWRRWINPRGGQVVDVYQAASILSEMWAREVTPGAIRVWATRGKVGRHGATEAGRTLYAVTELIDAATVLWGEPQRTAA